MAGSMCMSVWTLAIVSRCVLSPYPLFRSPFFHLPPPPKSLGTLLLHPSVLGTRLWRQRWCRSQQVCTSVASNFHSVLLLCHVWAPGKLPGPLRHRGSRTPSLPWCPCVPPRPHSRHTHGFDNKERVKDMVKEKYWGSLLPVSFTTELWLSSQESVPLLHNKREIMEWETETAGGGVSLSAPLLLPLWLSFLLLWFKNEKNTVEFFGTMEFFHFFLPSQAEFRNWGQRVCPSADGLYFDYGALVVMGDGRRGGVKGCVCAYKRLALKLQKAWSSHGPGRPTALNAARIGLPKPFDILMI